MTTPNYIRFFTKTKEINLLDIQPEDIDVDWIASAISNTYRWRLMTNPYITVAKHSCVCCRLVQAFPDVFNCRPHHALMHDMAEAFISDIPSTLKDCFPRIEEIEMQVLQAIYAHVGLPFPNEEAQKHVDNVDSWSGKFEAFAFHPQNDWLKEFPVNPFGVTLTEENLLEHPQMAQLFETTKRLYSNESFSFRHELDNCLKWV